MNTLIQNHFPTKSWTLLAILFELAFSTGGPKTVRDANDPYVQVLELIDQEYSIADSCQGSEGIEL